MQLFLTILLKLIPLYITIFFGYVGGRYLNVKKEAISPLLIYIIAPLIIFNGVIDTDISLATLSLPLIFFILCSLMCLVFYAISKHFWHDNSRNILAFTAGTGNTGYFGLPVAIALFDERLVGLVVLSILGFVLYENSLGFFITAKGSHTARESLLKVLKLPTLYAFILGVFINLSDISFGQIYTDYIISFRGAYTVLGMMLIGLGLSTMKEFKPDYKFVGISFFAKFITWPILALTIIHLDKMFLSLYDADFHKVMLLMSLVPLAANTVAYATELKAQPEKAAFAVLLSTIFALFYIPLVSSIFLQ